MIVCGALLKPLDRVRPGVLALVGFRHPTRELRAGGNRASALSFLTGFGSSSSAISAAIEGDADAAAERPGAERGKGDPSQNERRKRDRYPGGGLHAGKGASIGIPMAIHF